MRLVALSHLKKFWEKHPETKSSLNRWVAIIMRQNWETMAQVQSSFSKAKVLNSDRVRFEVDGGNYRLIAAFDFDRGLVFVKFIGTHAEYDRVDPFTIAQF